MNEETSFFKVIFKPQKTHLCDLNIFHWMEIKLKGFLDLHTAVLSHSKADTSRKVDYIWRSNVYSWLFGIWISFFYLLLVQAYLNLLNALYHIMRNLVMAMILCK